MEGSSLQISLPSDAIGASLMPAVNSLDTQTERRDMLLAAISLPTDQLEARDGEEPINLDEERSESSKSSNDVIATSTDTTRPPTPPDNGSGDASGDTSGDDEGPMGSDGVSGGSKGSGVMKRAWQPEEDQQLMQLVTELGPCHWSVIASYLEGRVGKQCRERCAPAPWRRSLPRVGIYFPTHCYMANRFPSAQLAQPPMPVGAQGGVVTRGGSYDHGARAALRD